jgi:hypothetical protein
MHRRPNATRQNGRRRRNISIHNILYILKSYCGFKKKHQSKPVSYETRYSLYKTLIKLVMYKHYHNLA